LVEAWDHCGENHARIQAEAGKVYRDFVRDHGDRGLVLFGSVKSNPAAELAFANCFKGAKPFQPEDAVAVPGDRSCPFMIRYRRRDPQPPSCCGGGRLSQQQQGNEPGLYYQTGLEEAWAHIPTNERCDGALVFYRFERGQDNRLEMVLGGFSGRATRCLAEYLLKSDAHGFWPPIISDRGVDVGVFIVKFSFRAPRNGSKKIPAHERVSKVEVIPLAKEVLVDRVKPMRRRRSQTTTVASRKAH
jgi:hypothetical protein